MVPLQGLPPPPARSMAHPSTWFDPAALPCSLGTALPPLGPPWPLHSLLCRHMSGPRCQPRAVPVHTIHIPPQSWRRDPGPTAACSPPTSLSDRGLPSGLHPSLELPESPVLTVKRLTTAGSGTAGHPAALLLRGVTSHHWGTSLWEDDIRCLASLDAQPSGIGFG